MKFFIFLCVLFLYWNFCLFFVDLGRGGNCFYFFGVEQFSSNRRSAAFDSQNLPKNAILAFL